MVAVQKASPTFVFLVGPSGSGKTWLSGKLAEHMDWPWFDTDALIEVREQRPISAIFSQNGEEYFRMIEREVLNSVLAENEQGIIATGGGMPTIEGTMKLMSENGITVYLEASIDELWNRLTVNRAELAKRPLLRSEGRSALERQLKQRGPIYASAEIIVRTDGLNADQVVDRVLVAITPLLSHP